MPGNGIHGAGVIRDEGNLIVIPRQNGGHEGVREEAPGGKASGSAREPGRGRTRGRDGTGAGTLGPGRNRGRAGTRKRSGIGAEPGRGQEPEPGRLRYAVGL